MKELLKTEWFKLTKSFGVKVLCMFDVSAVLLAIYMLSFGKKLTGYMGMSLGIGSALFHMAFGSLLAAVFLCNEFSNRTFGINLLSGHSRQQLFWSKTLVFLFGVLILFLLYMSAYSSVFTIANGFGDVKYSEVLLLLSCGGLGALTIGAFIIFITFFTQNTFITVAICNLLSNNVIDQAIEMYERRWNNPLLKYTFIYQFDQLAIRFNLLSGFVNSAKDAQRLDEFSLSLFLPVMLITLVITLAASAVIFEKRSLK